MTAASVRGGWAKKAVKLLLLAPASLGRPRDPGLYVLIYHRVGAGMEREMDVPTELFRAQMTYIRQRMEVVPLEDGLDALAQGSWSGRDKVALTFDDGYSEVYTKAWPVLSELGIPATVFVATGFAEGEFPPPIRPEAMGAGAEPRPLEWRQMKEMMEAGQISFGSHSHSHRVFGTLSRAAAEDEAVHSKEILERRLGSTVSVFAYPQAVPGNEDVISEHFRYAVAGIGAKNVVAGFDPRRVVRTPVRATDGMFFFRRRLTGILPLEDRVYEGIRRGAKE
ncbi:MAG: polysaccharide deacetylase family protein [Actinomycetota bacterium]